MYVASVVHTHVDALSWLHDDPVAVTASGYGTVDLGSGRVTATLPLDGRTPPGALIEFNVQDAAAGNTYAFVIRGSNDGFATFTELLRIPIAEGTVGTHQQPFTNQVFDTRFDEVRVFADLAGTAPSILYTARFGAFFAAPAMPGE